MPDDKLIEFVEQLSGEVHLRVEESLGSGFVRLRSAEAERRQAKHDIRSVEDIVIELLRNARDAGASNIFLATNKEEGTRTLAVIDDGVGIPFDLQKRVFEPRVTSKLDTMVIDRWGVHGRGMALYSVASNAQLARVACSAPELGAAILVETNPEELSERSDQSTLPQLTRNDQGALEISKGPHNIARAVVEFVLTEDLAINVYLGSPAQIAATLLEFGQKSLKREELLFCKDAKALPLVHRLAATGDSGELQEGSADMGLKLSERTAHRILAGQITPLKPLIKSVTGRAKTEQAAKSNHLHKDSRGLQISAQDSNHFVRALEGAFEVLGERYYLSLVDLPKVRVKGNTISVRFEIEKE
ncbi:MAG: ATP-binding protein [Coriobacteriia bacterium]|nr:ATP-binding protein [Coriobacteriia bacterium]